MTTTVVTILGVVLVVALALTGLLIRAAERYRRRN